MRGWNSTITRRVKVKKPPIKRAFFNGKKIARPNNKFGNRTAVYNGRAYDSIAEADYASILDLRKKAGEILEIKPQHKLSLDLNGVHICNYFVDFKVTVANGFVEYHEVKGFPTDLWQMKWKLALAIYGKEHFILIKV